MFILFTVLFTRKLSKIYLLFSFPPDQIYLAEQLKFLKEQNYLGGFWICNLFDTSSIFVLFLKPNCFIIYVIYSLNSTNTH